MLGGGFGLVLVAAGVAERLAAHPRPVGWDLIGAGLAFLLGVLAHVLYSAFKAAKEKPVPDVLIHQAIDHIVNDSKAGVNLPWQYTSGGFVVTDRTTGEPRLVIEAGYLHSEALRMIEERAIDGTLAVWGCRARYAGVNPNRNFEDVTREIAPSFWDLAQLDPLNCFGPSYREPQTVARPGSGSVSPNYTALMLNRAQVLRVWPAKSRLRSAWERYVVGVPAYTWDGSRSFRWPLFTPRSTGHDEAASE